MKTLTVFTPVYNRRELLGRVYESLLAQTCNDFVWLIIDDGSTDGTSELVKGYIKEGGIDIRYIYKENGGKHTATNTALKVADTPYIMLSLDSDDVLTSDAVETVISYIKKIENDNAQYNSITDESDKEKDAGTSDIMGIVFMKKNNAGKLLAKKIPKEGTVMSWRDAVTNGKFDGEALLIVKTAYAARFYSPVFEGEKFCTEGIMYLHYRRPFLWSSKAVYTAEYLETGYTANIKTLFADNPKSYRLYNKLRLKFEKVFIKRIKYAIYFNCFSILTGMKQIISRSPRKTLSLLTYPVGMAMARYISRFKTE